MRDLGDVVGAGVGERPASPEGLGPGAERLVAPRSRARRGRRARYVRDAAIAVPVVAAVVTAGWLGLGRHGEPPVTMPVPAPAPSVSAAPTRTPGVEPGDAVEEPDLPPYYAMPAGLLDTVGPGWVLATYAPRWLDSTASAPTAELVFLVAPEGTRYLVARLDPGAASVGGATTWTEHELVSWPAGGHSAVLREVTHRWVDGSETTERGAGRSLDLATGALISSGADAAAPPRGLSPDASLVLQTDDDGTMVVTRVADGSRVATLAPPTPDGWCEPAAWWTADSLLASCIDDTPAARSGDAVAADLHPRLVVVPVTEWGARSGTVVRSLAAGEPFPVWWESSATVADGVVAWQGAELSGAPQSAVCPTGVYLQNGADITRLPASTDPDVELNLYEARAVDGAVYVDATGGCSGDGRPHVLTRYDVATGATTTLVGLPTSTAWSGDRMLQGLTSYVVRGEGA